MAGFILLVLVLLVLVPPGCALLVKAVSAASEARLTRAERRLALDERRQRVEIERQVHAQRVLDNFFKPPPPLT